MAVLTLIELLKGTSDPVQSGVLEHLITVDEVVPNLPFASLGSRDSITYRREKALPVVSKIASGDTITPNASLAYTRVQSFVRRIVVDQDIDILDAGAAGGMIDARASAMEKGMKAIGRAYADDIVTGNSNFTCTATEFGATQVSAATITVGPGHDTRQPFGTFRYVHAGTLLSYKAPGDNAFGTAAAYSAGARVYSSNEDKWATFTVTGGAFGANGDITFTISGGDKEIDGMARLVASGQTIAATGANGDSISFAGLDQLADQVTDANGPKVYICNRTIRRRIAAVLRAAGGATMAEFKGVQVPGYKSAVYLNYNGLPILATDYILSNRTIGATTTASQVFCATLGPDAGLSGLYSEASLDAADAGSILMQQVNGLMCLDIGTVQNADTKRIRCKGYLGLKCGSEKGLAVLNDVL